MGKKSKVGKARKDKFYRLAKESGYRARSAFKLIQLNRKFAFLEQARVVVDLCAAPGGWLQVAAENTPVSSLILGVDLVSIRPIPKCTTFTADITTEKCKQILQQEMKTWKADVFLNDGAPNVGKNWIHDAYQQAELTLYAVKLATDFLRKGGWFVTKVFRSKDYYSLLWVLQQLFSNVHATKPQASRNESAEIFVVCQGFLAPDKIDPKFLNPKHVFKEVEPTTKRMINLMHPEKKRRHRDGYAEGDTTLFHQLQASTFLKSENYMDLLAETNQVVLDEKWIANHKLTNIEMKECLCDIKVLGKKDIKSVLTWRKKLREELGDAKAVDKAKEEDKPIESTQSDDDENDIEQQLGKMEEEERRTLKRKLKKTRQEKTKLRHRMDLKMDQPNDRLDLADDIDLFDIKKIKSRKHLKAVDKGEEIELDEAEAEEPPSKRRTVSYDRHAPYSGEREGPDDDLYSSDPELYDDEPIDTHVDEDDNPLVVDIMKKSERKQSKLNSWFNKSAFSSLDDDMDEDEELDTMADRYKKQGRTITGADTADSDTDMSDTDSDTDSDFDISNMQMTTTQAQQPNAKNARTAEKDGFQIVASDSGAAKRLDAAGMALGAALVQSQKRRREIIDGAYHRYTFNDESLPDWFMKDEKKHNRVQLPVTKGDIQEYRDKQKAIDAKPIKKVAEAKARRKKKDMRKLERARKRADVINETTEVSDKEKWQQIKQVYKKAGLLGKKKKEISYVVAKKGMGKRARRPAGVSGPYRVVDKRLKKDKRGTMRANMRAKKQSKTQKSRGKK